MGEPETADIRQVNMVIDQLIFLDVESVKQRLIDEVP